MKRTGRRVNLKNISLEENLRRLKGRLTNEGLGQGSGPLSEGRKGGSPRDGEAKSTSLSPPT
jgi:hypothetical protein